MDNAQEDQASSGSEGGGVSPLSTVELGANSGWTSDDDGRLTSDAASTDFDVIETDEDKDMRQSGRSGSVTFSSRDEIKEIPYGNQPSFTSTSENKDGLGPMPSEDIEFGRSRLARRNTKAKPIAEGTNARVSLVTDMETGKKGGTRYQQALVRIGFFSHEFFSRYTISSS